MDIKNRSELDPSFLWDTSHIFPSTECWEVAFREAEASLAEVAALADANIGSSADTLAQALDKLYSVSHRCELVYLYAMFHRDGDGGESEFQTMHSKALGLTVKLQAASSFLEPAILSVDSVRLDSYLREDRLKKYRHIIDSTVRMREHILDSDRELMLAKLGDAAETPSSAYGMLTNVDMEFPEITDENGNKVKLTSANFSVFRESPDRSVRESAFRAFFGEYKKLINTVAALYEGSVKLDNYDADVRGYKDACERALYSGNVPVSVYDSLITAINDSLPTMRKYIELRRRVMGLDKIDMFDMYVPMVPEADFDMPYAKGCETVIEALRPLGEKYISVIKRAINERWIDVYENKGKRSGAYSCGVYGVHPYILLNYTDKLDDAFTLAHELGHAMHSYLSAEAQDYCNADYKIMVAEVASTVNEVLLTVHLLNTESDKMRRAAILNHLLEGFRTTVYRQTLFAEFERTAHGMQQNGEPLTAKALSDLYYGLVCKYYGGCEVDGIIAVEWSYIPHFYNAYYVYQYATGFCAAVAIVKNILETGNADSYLKFLTLGGTDYPINELKSAGIDLTDSRTVSDALAMFDQKIDELAELLK